MPAYFWTYYACGERNNPDVTRCTRCKSPAAPSHQEIKTFRERHLARGGTLSSDLESSLSDKQETVRVFGQMLAWVLFGYRPRK